MGHCVPALPKGHGLNVPWSANRIGPQERNTFATHERHWRPRVHGLCWGERAVAPKVLVPESKSETLASQVPVCAGCFEQQVWLFPGEFLERDGWTSPIPDSVAWPCTKGKGRRRDCRAAFRRQKASTLRACLDPLIYLRSTIRLVAE